MTLRASAVGVLLVLGGAGCGGDAACVAGTAQACACTDGRMGAQVCVADGTGFGACVCTGGSDGGAVDGGGADGGGGGRLDGGEDAGGDGGWRLDGGEDAGGDGGAGATTYDDLVLADGPVGYWRMSETGGTEPDLSAGGNDGSYRGGPRAAATMPNGDPVVVFDGSSASLTIASRAVYSISTTGDLTWEAWIRPDVLMFPHSSGGYVDWMGKCAEYSPTCEWEARMYDTTNPQGRCNRLSAYAFNPSAGLGSGADWQPTCGLFEAGRWLHVVGEYTTRSEPPTCPTDPAHPGSLNIWVNGIPWDQSSHSPTGCMTQYDVVPVANDSPVNIGTMAGDSWFAGAIGKVAIYATLLSQERITAHYRAMTGAEPSGTCADTCTF